MQTEKEHGRAKKQGRGAIVPSEYVMRDRKKAEFLNEFIKTGQKGGVKVKRMPSIKYMRISRIIIDKLERNV